MRILGRLGKLQHICIAYHSFVCGSNWKFFLVKRPGQGAGRLLWGLMLSILKVRLEPPGLRHGVKSVSYSPSSSCRSCRPHAQNKQTPESNCTVTAAEKQDDASYESMSVHIQEHQPLL